MTAFTFRTRLTLLIAFCFGVSLFSTDTIAPSFRVIIILHLAASSWSCVTTISVLPNDLFNSNNSLIILSPVALSKFPVGSSANIRFGFVTIALAIA